MAKQRADDSFDIVAALCKRYACFCHDINYYENIVNSFKGHSLDKVFQMSDSMVLSEIRSSLKTNNEWFLKYVSDTLKSNKPVMRKLNTIANLCLKWYIEIDIDTLSILLDKSKDLNDALKSALGSLSPITISNIENLTNNKTLIDILIGYASIKNLIVDEQEEELDEQEPKEKSYDSYYNDDIIKIYMREMGQYPLLTPEEEREIATLAEAGNEKAKKKLAEHNLRLVLNIAKRYVGRGLDFADLIQAGNEGLLKAIDRYKPGKGFKFSTYATWWIRQSIDRTIKDEGRTIRIPVHAQDTYFKIVKTRENLVKVYGEKVTWDDVAEELGMDSDQVNEIVLSFRDNISMDAPVAEGEDTEYGDFISNPDELTPEDMVINDSLKDSLAEVLSTLSTREEQIIRIRFGVQDPNNPLPQYSNSHTLEEVGAMFEVTRERIRQIEAKALRKLRHPTRARKLGAYAGDVSSTPQSAAAVDYGEKMASRKKKNLAPKKPSGNKRTPVNSPIKVIKPGDPEWTPSQNIKKQPSSYHTSFYSKNNIPKEEDNMGERRNFKELKYLYEVLECTKEELDYIKPYLKSQKELSSYKIMFDIYGDELDNRGSMDGYDNEARKDFYNGLNAIKSRIRRLKSLGFKSFQEVLGVSDEYYSEVLTFIDSRPEKEVIISVHGKDLGVYANVAILNRKDEGTYNRFVTEIQKYVTNLQTRSTLKTLLSCPDSIWPCVKDMIDRNSDLQELFFPSFGSSLDLRENYSNVPSNKRKRYSKAIEYLKSLVISASKYEGKSITEVLDISSEILANNISVLKENNFLTSLFGPNLDEAINIVNYLLIGDKELASIKKTVKQKTKPNRGANLQQVFGLKDEDMDIITYLNKSFDTNDRYKDKMRAAYGDDLTLGKANDVDTYNIITKLKSKVEIALKIKNKTMYEVFELTPSQFVKVRDLLLKTKFCDVALRIYGSDLTSKADLTAFFAEDGRSYYGFTVGIGNIVAGAKGEVTELDVLINNYQGKMLWEIVGCDENEIKDLILKSGNEEFDISLIHGGDLDKPFDVLSPRINLKLCGDYASYVRKLQAIRGGQGQNQPEPAASGLNNEIPNPEGLNLYDYSHPLFREAIKVVPINYRYILMLHLGLQDDGVCYPVETLMSIFNRSREEIEDALLRGKIFFDEIVAAYEKVYTSQFPKVELPDVSRKRSNQNQ